LISKEHIYNPVAKEINLEEDLLRLISGCIVQDRKAQRTLYGKYASMVYGIIRRYEEHIEIAEEILNDVFILVFTKIEQYSFSGSFEGWIRRITVNCTADYFRKNAKHKKLIPTDFENINPYIDTNVCNNIYYKELLAIVHSLPDMQRAVFNLFVFEDHTHMDIAKELKISEGYSKWYLNDARKRIKEKITSMM